MSLAALAALTAGSGTTPWMVGVALVIGLALAWPPVDRFAALVERGTKLVAVALFGWILYLGLIAGGDVLEPGIALLIVLLAGEVLRPLDVSNDFRLYSLSFGLVIAATAYYPGVAFGLAFTAYIVLATLALMVGHLRRQAETYRIADLRVGRSFLAVTALLSVVTLLASLVIFVTFPRLPRTWSGQGRAQAGAIAGFSNVVSIGEHGGRLRPNPEVMFRVEFQGPPRDDPSGTYWRGLSFDHFDGTRWTRNRQREDRDEMLPPFIYGMRWGQPVTEYRVFGGPPGVRVLFGQHPIVGLRPQSAIEPRLQRNGDIGYVGWDAPVYTVRSGPVLPPETLLRGSVDGPAPHGTLYLQLPPLPPRVAQLADSLTRTHETRIDQVRAVERFLREEFRYSLDLPSSSRTATLDHFLFQRRAGHCEYFSTAMVVLLRSAGIPSRNVNGFLGGEWNERAGYLAVTGNNAHSWVEVFFPELGWVPFDGTPVADRDETLAREGASTVWPVLFWLDGLQFRWYRWVMAYDLESQIRIARSLGDRFTPGPRTGGPSEIPWSTLMPWFLGIATIAGVVALGRGRRRPRHAAETRRYLALRRRYAAAGYPVRPSDPPLRFVEDLRASGAPGVDDAEWIVSRYLRARFDDDDMDAAENLEAAARLKAVRRAISGSRAPAGGGDRKRVSAGGSGAEPPG